MSQNLIILCLTGVVCLGVGLVAGSFFAGRYGHTVTEEMPGLIRQLLQTGYYDLPCGGGPLFTPDQAEEDGALKYGAVRYRYLNLALLYDPFVIAEAPDEAGRVAYAVLYRMADLPFLDELIRLRMQLNPDLAGTDGSIQKYPLDTLIQLIAHKLKCGCPEGMVPMDAKEMDDLICRWMC